jgi:predicted enzyme related to lactoylglutathione lyase
MRFGAGRSLYCMLTDSQAYSSFAVPDIGEAERFYADVLGLRTDVLSEEFGLLVLHLAGGRDTFIYAKPDHEPANFTILNFPVADLEGTVDALAERGVTFERYDGLDQDERGIARGDQGPAIAWFTDPAGNVFALHEPM